MSTDANHRYLTPPTPKHREEREDAAARLKAFVRKHAPGGCLRVSIGEHCTCALCDVDRLRTHSPEERERHGWQVEHGVTCVVCPGCAFTFDAGHEDSEGGYTCPNCEGVQGERKPVGPVYCPECESCDVDDCCPAERCTGGERCLYPDKQKSVGDGWMGCIYCGYTRKDGSEIEEPCLRGLTHTWTEGTPGDIPGPYKHLVALIREQEAEIARLRAVGGGLEWRTGGEMDCVGDPREGVHGGREPVAWEPWDTCPTDHRVVLAYFEPGHIETVCRGEDGWWFAYDGDRTERDPTHWMARPALPVGQPQRGESDEA